MQIVIKISEEDYKKIIEYGECDYLRIINAIENGTLFPKGHGRLGDLDALREEVSSWGMNDYEPSDFIDEIDRADTVIPADKTESEE